MTIKTFEDPYYRLDNLGLIDKKYLTDENIGTAGRIDKFSEKEGILSSQVLRSCAYWGIRPYKDQTKRVWPEMDYKALVEDYVESGLSLEQMSEKYGVNYWRIIKSMQFRKSDLGKNRAKERRKEGASKYYTETNRRRNESDIDNEIAAALSSSEPIKALLAIDPNLDYKPTYDNLRPDSEIVKNGDFGGYEYKDAEFIDEYHLKDPYVEGGVLLTRKAFNECEKLTVVKKIAEKYDVTPEEVHRSAFRLGIIVGKVSGECEGDYVEFVQDYVDGRLGNEALVLKYGGDARKMAMARMGLKRSDIGVKRMKARQSGKLLDDISEYKERAPYLKISKALLGAIDSVEEINADILNVFKKGGVTERKIVTALNTKNDFSNDTVFEVRKIESDTGVWMKDRPNDLDEDLTYSLLYDLRFDQCLLKSEIAEKTGKELAKVKFALSYYNIKPDKTNEIYIEYRRRARLTNPDDIDGYENMSTERKRIATYDYRHGTNGGPLSDPEVRDKMLDDAERKTGYRSLGIGNPVYLKRYKDKCEADGVYAFNAQNPEWQSEHGGHGFSSGPSHNEQEMIDYLSSHGVESDQYRLNDYSVLKDHELDFYFKGEDFAIEINPTYTHRSNRSSQMDTVSPKSATYHFDKTKTAMEHGVALLSVFDWMNQKDERQDTMREYLLWRINGSSSIGGSLAFERTNGFKMWPVDGRPSLGKIGIDYRIVSSGKNVGFLTCHIDNGDTLVIDYIAMVDYGLCERAFKEASKMAKDKGCPRTKVHVSNNMPLDDVLKAAGFVLESSSPAIGCYQARKKVRNWMISIDEAARLATDSHKEDSNEDLDTIIETGLGCRYDLIYDCGMSIWSREID